ncbi:MAG TPA: zinc metallopeptidase [Verrucomicrobiales bacterium]|nr:zinc metallopeptidase [Verrucomicrobiales bacterium]
MTLGFILDPAWFLFAIPGLIIGFIASTRLRSTYARYLRVPAMSGLTGAQAAREILDRAGMADMPIREVRGQLSDHYDPLRKQLCLSSDNYHGRSLAALGVAAHEAGHALQHQHAYAPLNFRMAIVPLANIATSLSGILIMLGFFIASTAGKTMMIAGIALFGCYTLFQLVTLPVEYDASRRAKLMLVKHGLISRQEETGVSRVLNAAALTYVAAMVAAVLQLLYFLSLFNRRD